MGRIVTIMQMLLMSLALHANQELTFDKNLIGEYIVIESLSSIDKNKTLKQGYICYGNKNSYIKMLFDISEDRIRYTEISLTLDDYSNHNLNCIQSEKPSDYSIDIFNIKEEISTYLENLGYKSSKKSDIRTYRKIIKSKYGCFEVKDKFEGNYSYIGDYLKESIITMKYRNSELISISKTISIQKNLEKLLENELCE